MGKASKFFKSLLGFKTTKDTATPPARSDNNNNNKQSKRRWSFVKSHRENFGPSRLRNTSKSLDGNSFHHNLTENEDPNEHAIALAAATAAVVDAAVAAAQAAAEVVRITSRNTGYGVRGEFAAIKIQSCFRAYLARRALRALKALVKLQAVVRGHILRKQTADMMRRLQALIRAQARARAARSQISDSTTTKSSHIHHHRNNSKSYTRSLHGQERTFLEGSMDHESDKIVEVDNMEPYVMTRRTKLFQPDQINYEYNNSHSLTTSKGSTVQPTSSSPCASCEVNSFDDSMRGGVVTPNKSEGSRSCISGYSYHHPNYMANTESSRAKVRSLSAPRLRPHFEVTNATKKDSGYKYMSGMQWVPTMRDSFSRKAYPGSGRLDRLGMPIYYVEESEVCSGYWN